MSGSGNNAGVTAGLTEAHGLCLDLGFSALSPPPWATLRALSQRSVSAVGSVPLLLLILSPRKAVAVPPSASPLLLISASPFSPVASSLPVPVDASCLPGGPITSLSLALLPCDCTSMVPVCGSPPLLRDEPQRFGQQFRVPCSTNGGQPILGIQVSMCGLGSACINRRGGAGGRSRLCLVVINKYIVLRLLLMLWKRGSDVT